MDRTPQNRRDFLKTGLAGAAGLALLGGRGVSAGPFRTGDRPTAVRTLGRTGIRLPVVSMGAGDTQDPALVTAALDAGIVLLATSAYYYNGQNETMIGRIVKGRKRDSAVIMTSAMADGFDHKAGVWTASTRAEPFVEKFEGCLKRLEMETVDIFLLPFVARRESVFFEPLLRAMEKIRKEGKARFIGVATHQFEHEAIRAAAETGVYDVVMTALNFRKDNRLEILSAAEAASKAGMGVIAMKTMAGAFWDREKTKPINASAALKWAVQNPCVTTAVPGITTYEQLAADVAVMRDPSLTAGEKAELQLSAAAPADGPFCQQCGQCVGQCRDGLDMPTLMRSYMYAYGYGNLEHARQTLALARRPENVCGECRDCAVRCPMRSDVRGKIRDIARLESLDFNRMA
ncbi:MAG: aldo/keto reductase [bacterium]|nr:aldo/keto reductase [bacterium]